MKRDLPLQQEASEAGPCRTLEIWVAISALLPIVAAFCIVALPVLPAVQDSADVGPTQFLLDKASPAELSDSLQAAYVRTDRLRTVLRAEEAFLAAMISESSSRYPALWIDLHDSTATLSIQGVPVRTSRIAAFERSVLFDIYRATETGMDSLRIPFKLFGASANIARVPVRVVHAPKDTTEAQARPPQAFVKDEGDVYADLYFDRNLVVHLVPATPGRNWLEALAIGLEKRVQEAVKTVGEFVSSDRKPLTLWVQLEMDSDDIRAIYRAVPDGGSMAIRW